MSRWGGRWRRREGTRKNKLKNNVDMKKILFYFLLIGGMLVMGSRVDAQLRTLPSVVTDSFKVHYPSAAQVSWSDKLSYWQANFYLGADALTAKFKSTGEWQSAMKKIAQPLGGLVAMMFATTAALRCDSMSIRSL